MTQYVQRVCSECGSAFYTPPSSAKRSRVRQTCGDRCMVKRISRMQREFWDDWRAETQRRREGAA